MFDGFRGTQTTTTSLGFVSYNSVAPRSALLPASCPLWVVSSGPRIRTHLASPSIALRSPKLRAHLATMSLSQTGC